MANRLAQETSPYLLQHAHNPVDWYPWGEEALDRARALDRPIFLSIGYAACHWCHVMERESFENQATAELLNRSFVSIKVDREERPDLDAIYMDAVQSMTGRGGWPMSVFLTPDGAPFYGGTYFPDEPRHGMPSFRELLEAIHVAWTDRRPELEVAGASLIQALQPRSPTAGPITAEILEGAVQALTESEDQTDGGWGQAPKFPQPMAIEFLIREHLRTGAHHPLSMAQRTLDAMASGGIYDHLGGGFARYATDRSWLVPHFEKMLYDNAQLARAYLHSWAVTGSARHRDVAEETLDFMARELRIPEGGFCSSLDADTHGEEGLTYVWDAPEIRSLLGEDAPLFERAYGVRSGGNWEGRTILSRVTDPASLASTFGVPEDELEDRLRTARATLLTARTARPQPARDDKVLTAWNGLTIAAYADASWMLGSERYRQIAEEAAAFLLEALLDKDGRLRRSWKGGRARQAAVLEDEANLASGLLALYRATFEERWFLAAQERVEVMLRHFSHPEGGFFDTADDHERLITRPRGLQDSALPSGNATAASVLLELAQLTGESHHHDAAERTLQLIAPIAARFPAAFAQWLQGMQRLLSPGLEIAIVGAPTEAPTMAMIEVVRASYRPFDAIAVGAGSESSAVPLLHDRTALEGRTTAYVCQAFACQQPVTSPDALAAQLAAADGPFGTRDRELDLDRELNRAD